MAAAIVPFSITAPGFFGLNSQDAPVDMDSKYALEANNCIIDRFGRVGSRKGWTPYHTANTALGANNVEAIGELVSNAGVRTTVCAGNNKLFKWVTGTPATLVELTYGGGGVAPTITTNNWQLVQLNGVMLFFQRGYDCLIFDPATSATTYRRLSEHATYSGTAPLANCALSAYGRIWAADTATDKNTVTWSDTLTFQKWTGGTAGSLNLYGVWPNGGDEIVALAAHNNTLIIFGKQQTLIYSGADSPADMRLADAIANTGCAARDSVANTPSDIFYLSQEGVTSIKRTIQEKSAPLANVSRNVNDDVKAYTASVSNSLRIKGIYSPIDSFYLLSFVDVGTTYCFDTRSTLQDGSHRATVWYGIAPKCYCYSADKILRMGFPGYIGNHTGYMDNTAQYRLTYYSTWIDFGDPIRTSILKKIIMTLFGAIGQSIVYKWGFDYSSQFQAQPITTSNTAASEYNIAEYDIGEYSGTLSVRTLLVNTTGAGKVIQVGLETQVIGFPISVQRVDIFTKDGAYK